MTEHTPGPWIYRTPNYEQLKSINADLLASLETILEAGEYDDNGDFVLAHTPWNGKDDPPDTSDPQSIQQAQAAIAKARNLED